MKKLINISEFKHKALHWANQFEVCCFLDSNGYKDKYSAFDFSVACGVQNECLATEMDSFKKLEAFQMLHKNWLFGMFSYELKNEVEKLASKNIDHLQFPNLYFFLPKFLIICKNGQVEVILGDEKIVNEINNFEQPRSVKPQNLTLTARIDKRQYLKTIDKLQEHIAKGDIYEINFCQEFFAEHAHINPVECFEKLNQLSPNPLAGYFKIYDKFILSASPERFLCKLEDKLIAQPIKGTSKRYENPLEDKEAKLNLQTNEKERAENVMIVDLTRNDLTKVCEKGSVKVEELFEVYSFPQVHQMISTVTGSCNKETTLVEIIKKTFPMGSMTGAPKLSAMLLIEEYERTKRGIFSGSIGYVTPENDFDFNVVIRTVLYNATAKHLSFQVGGAITFLSDPEKEYEECLLKASAMFSILK
ncbi:para-aminobenzoate synthetase component 1 [Pedobacter sp. UYP30]|uniref:anthranilate synthase component I family protein n=1 Tax=Pedobacter sp. UYP30 TaxID=1756400 RepID=UPI00339839C0